MACIVSWGGLFALLLLFYAGAILPIQELGQSYARDLRRVEGRIDRYRELLAGEGELRKAVKTLEDRNIGADFYRGLTPTQVSNEIQGIVSRLVRGAAATLVRTNASQPQDTGIPYQRLDIDTHFNAKLDQLDKILSGLAKQQPRLFITSLNISAREPTVNRKGLPLPPILTVNLTLSAYLDAPVNKGDAR